MLAVLLWVFRRSDRPNQASRPARSTGVQAPAGEHKRAVRQRSCPLVCSNRRGNERDAFFQLWRKAGLHVERNSCWRIPLRVKRYGARVVHISVLVRLDKVGAGSGGESSGCRGGGDCEGSSGRGGRGRGRRRGRRRRQGMTVIIALRSPLSRPLHCQHMPTTGTHHARPSKHPQRDRASRSARVAGGTDARIRTGHTPESVATHSREAASQSTHLVKAREQLDKLAVDRGPLGSHAAPCACRSAAVPRCGGPLGRLPRIVRKPAACSSHGMGQHGSSRCGASPTGALPTALVAASPLRRRWRVMQPRVGHHHRSGSPLAPAASLVSCGPCAAASAGCLSEALRETVVDLRLDRPEVGSVAVLGLQHEQLAARVGRIRKRKRLPVGGDRHNSAAVLCATLQKPCGAAVRRPCRHLPRRCQRWAQRHRCREADKLPGGGGG